MDRRLKALRAELEAAGLKPDSPEFAREERRQKVELCKQVKNVVSCWDCSYFDHCELIKAHLRDMYNAEQKSKP